MARCLDPPWGALHRPLRGPAARERAVQGPRTRDPPAPACRRPRAGPASVLAAGGEGASWMGWGTQVPARYTSCKAPRRSGGEACATRAPERGAGGARPLAWTRPAPGGPSAPHPSWSTWWHVGNPYRSCRIPRRARERTSRRCLGTSTTEASLQQVWHMLAAWFHWGSLPRQGSDCGAVAYRQQVVGRLTGPARGLREA